MITNHLELVSKCLDLSSVSLSNLCIEKLVQFFTDFVCFCLKVDPYNFALLGHRDGFQSARTMQCLIGYLKLKS